MTTARLPRFPAKNIVIIGDGPTALAIAIMLAERKIANISIVGPRHGNYTRSGDYLEEVFTAINQAIAPASIDSFFTDKHIKEVERQLYDIAIKRDIKFIKKKFVGFGSEDRSILLAEANDKEHMQMLRADLVFDCTGAKREVINQFNLQPEAFKFQIQPAGLFIENTWAMARLTLPKKANVDIPFLCEIDPLKCALTLEKLHLLGWEHNMLPVCYTHKRTHIKEDKCNMYFQVPAQATADQVETIARLMYSLGYFDDNFSQQTLEQVRFHHSSKKHPEKPVISRFLLTPQITTPGTFGGNDKYPVIIHAGDATFNIPFIAANGMINCMWRIRKLFACMVIENGAIAAIDFDQYEKSLPELIQEPLSRIKQHEEELKRFYAQDNSEMIEIYNAALIQCNDPYQKAIIQNGLNLMQRAKSHVNTDTPTYKR